jgi:hypothetical protein
MNVKRQFAVVIMLVTLSLVLAEISPAFGCTSLPAAQPWIAQFDTEIAEAERWVAGCSDANWQNCIQADRHLDYAASAIDHILGVCIDRQRGDCLLGEVRTLDPLISRLGLVENRLITQSSMRRNKADSEI